MEAKHFGAFVVEAPSILTIAKLFKSPTPNARPIIVVITTAGDLAQACNLPEGPGSLKIDPATSKASWRNDVTGHVQTLHPLDDVVMPVSTSYYSINAATSKLERCYTNHARSQTVILESNMKPKPVMQRRFFYTYGVKGIGIYAKPDFEDDNAPEAQEMLAKVRSKLNADLTARCISKRIREIPHCSATSVDLIHF